MSSISSEKPTAGRAEMAFMAAFERLKSNTPNIVPRGSVVSQNNVAREAGLDPSALKKSRFPRLVAEIQGWINNEQKISPAKNSISEKRNQNRSLRDRLMAMKEQRDNALGLLAEADALILELTREIERLHLGRPASKVSPIKGLSS